MDEPVAGVEVGRVVVVAVSAVDVVEGPIGGAVGVGVGVGSFGIGKQQRA